MGDYLCVTVQWVTDRYHGVQSDGETPEWPPSPFRLFQTLLASGLRTGSKNDVSATLQWFEKNPTPEIIAANTEIGTTRNHFVPDNDNSLSHRRSSFRKFHPSIFLGESPHQVSVHYLWDVQTMGTLPFRELTNLVNCIGCFGWAVDFAFARALFATSAEVSDIKGTRWTPRPQVLPSADALRVPRAGSLSDLHYAYSKNVCRIIDFTERRGTIRPKIFDRVVYTNSARPLGRPCQLFSLRTTTGELSREPQAKLMHVAGMVRHAAIAAMRACPPPGAPDPAKWIETSAAGHRNGNDNHHQFSYVPLPSIGHPHADCDIRRVMIVAPFDQESNLRHLAQQLNGWRFEREGGGEAPILEQIRDDNVTRQYTDRSATWATVTPIILPGHDDHKPAKTKKLLDTALRQSGVEQPCEFTWSSMPNFRHSLPAFKHDRQGRHIGYFRPNHLDKFTLVHARLTFTTPVPGPMIIGAGRHCGFGVCAVVDAATRDADF